MPFDNPVRDRNDTGRVPLPVDVHVGRQLRLARKNRNLSQEALAGALGLTFQQVQKYERGDNRLSASKMYAAAHFLRVEIAFFFDGLPSPLTGDAGDVAVPTVGHALVDLPYGVQLARDYYALTNQDRLIVASLARRLVAGAERG